MSKHPTGHDRSAQNTGHLDHPGQAPRDARSLASALVPALQEACEGRLGPITWFRTDWQRGGAATGTGVLHNSDGSETAVIVKLPVNQRELIWTRRLQNGDGSPSWPILFAGDDFLGGYDLAWIVIEKFAHGPLGLHWHDNHIHRIADAAARFHLATSQFPVDRSPTTEPWAEELEESLQSIRVNALSDSQRWTKAVKALQQKLDAVLAEWTSRDCKQWLHGDLHLANAMSRVAMNEGPVCLIDLAEVRAGHWIEDAIYLERQLWARPERLAPHKPVKCIANARKALGLPVESEYPRLAAIRRALLAATAPKFIKSEGNPKHLAACLDRLEVSLNEIR